MRCLVFATMLFGTACHDASSFTSKDRGRLVERQQLQSARTRQAEITIRNFGDLSTNRGRKRLREAAALRGEDERLLEEAKAVNVTD